jgi:nitroreductase
LIYAGIVFKLLNEKEVFMMEPIELPGKKAGREMPVLKALEKRKTIREISGRKLTLQALSNLLWAASGINRKKGPFEVPGRTAASASNSQEIDIYVALENGAYLYDALAHRLIPVSQEDLRPLAIGPGQSGFASIAPVRLIYVADIGKLTNTAGYQEPGLHDPEIQKSYYYVDTGLIAGNVYLFAASQGLASWFHNCDKSRLASKLSLRPEQRVLFGHTVGYPAGSRRTARPSI